MMIINKGNIKSFFPSRENKAWTNLLIWFNIKTNLKLKLHKNEFADEVVSNFAAMVNMNWLVFI